MNNDSMSSFLISVDSSLESRHSPVIDIFERLGHGLHQLHAELEQVLKERTSSSEVKLADVPVQLVNAIDASIKVAQLEVQARHFKDIGKAIDDLANDRCETPNADFEQYYNKIDDMQKQLSISFAGPR